MSAKTMFGAVSHSPLILIRPEAPADEPKIQALNDRFRAEVEKLDPEQIVFFGNNHFAGFHYSNMPPYCIGTRCEAVDDLGGTPGTIPVPEADAIALVDYLRNEGFDPAISYKMMVDHGFTQPLARLLGGIDKYPLIPVFISVFTPPLMRYRRSRLIGEAVGRFIAQSGKRTLIMGTGGISHHPVRYFPIMGTAEEKVFGYQLDGERGGTMSDEQWFKRFADMHIEGAQMVADGLRTAQDMRMNPDFDLDFLRRIAEAPLEEMDDWDQAELIEKAGVGSLELHTWIAAAAAFRVNAGVAPLTTFYSPTVEYGTGYGMAFSSL